MIPPYAFPVILIFINLCAAAVYAIHYDWRMAIYWLAAATLTTCVTFEW